MDPRQASEELPENSSPSNDLLEGDPGFDSDALGSAGSGGDTRSEGFPAGDQAESDVSFQSLAPQQVTFERRTSIITYLVLGLIVLAVGCFPMGVYFGVWWCWLLILASWLALNIVLILLAFWWPPKSYRNRSWRMTLEGMEIRQGVWWKHRIAIPVARVQHVDVSQGPVQRMFDLSTLVVHTAGTKNASISLEGLTYAKAMEVRDALIAQKEALDVT